MVVAAPSAPPTRVRAARRVGRRPRHYWLNGGVAPTQIAEWAGHSVEILHRVYAKCLEGQDEFAKRRIIAALGEDTDVARDTRSR